MLYEMKLEAIEWYYMEIDHAIKHGKISNHDEVFEKTLDTAMRGMSDFEYMVWCFEIASRFERQNIPMCDSHVAEIIKALDIYEKTDILSLGLSAEEIPVLKKDHDNIKKYLEQLSKQRF